MQFPLSLLKVYLQRTSISLFIPDKEAVKYAFKHGLIETPYWSQVWPSAKALANFILANPDYTKGKCVLELGAGLGLPSFAAARNAKHVLCTDQFPAAVEIANQSARQLELENFVAETFNWQELPNDLQTDVLLLSDVNYEPGIFASLSNVIDSFLAKGTTILISTPQRLMAKEFILSLLPYCKQKEDTVIKHEGDDVLITTLVLQRNEG